MKLNYDELTKIVATQKRFRGRKEEQYPTHGWRYRNHSHKFFSYDEVDGEIVYRINYGANYKRVVVTPEESELLKKLGKDMRCNNVVRYDERTQMWEETTDVEHYYYDSSPCELGIVRPDNTFEFTHENNLGQGVRHYLEHYCFQDWVYADCRKGGVTLDRKYPLFNGLRIDLDTMTPAQTQQIELYKKRINRKAAKQLMSEYDEMFSVSKAMFSQMEKEVFVNTFKEVLSEQGVVWMWQQDKPNLQYTKHSEVVKMADKLRLEGNYFESAMLYAYGYDLQGMTWRVRHNSNWINKDVFLNLDKSMKKILYRAHKPFDLIPVADCDGSTEWGYAIKHNGKEVNQYRY